MRRSPKSKCCKFECYAFERQNPNASDTSGGFSSGFWSAASNVSTLALLSPGASGESYHTFVRPNHHSLLLAGNILNFTPGPGKWWGIIFRAVDEDNFYYVRMRDVQESVSQPGHFYFTSEIVHRSGGSDSVISSKEIRPLIGNILYFSVGIGLNPDLSSSIRVQHYSFESVAGSQYFGQRDDVYDVISHFASQPWSQTGPALPSGGFVGAITNNDDGAIFNLGQSIGSLGNEDGGECEMLDFYHPHQVSAFLPTRWQITGRTADIEFNFGVIPGVEFSHQVQVFRSEAILGEGSPVAGRAVVTYPRFGPFFAEGYRNRYPFEGGGIDYQEGLFAMNFIFSDLRLGPHYRLEFSGDSEFDLWQYSEGSPLTKDDMIEVNPGSLQRLDRLEMWPLQE